VTTLFKFGKKKRDQDHIQTTSDSTGAYVSEAVSREIVAAIAAAVAAYTGVKPSGLIVRRVVRRRQI